MFGKINFGGPPVFALKKIQTQNNKLRRSQQQSQSKEQHRHKSFKDKKIKKQKKSLKNMFDLQTQAVSLQGAKFRLLNQMLYSNNSAYAVEYFKNNQEDFSIYHQGYRHQAQKWHKKPVDAIIQFLVKNNQHYQHKIIADLGCGEGFIHQKLVEKGFSESKIKSYDLVKAKPFIVQADIAKLPLESRKVDLCVFCLSLMGTNYLEFIKQARRVLKDNGQLIVSEVQSRSPNWKKFIQMITLVGFSLINDGLDLIINQQKQKKSNNQSRFFRTMHFRKQPVQNQNTTITIDGLKYSLQQASTRLLQICTYKKR